MNTDGDEKGERKDMLKGECWINARVERKETRDNNGGVITATESPWFLVKGKNLLVREVNFSLLQLALLNRPRTDQQLP